MKIPIGFSAGDTNLYRHVNNSPTNWTDPSGTTISGWLDDALNGVDSLVAGFANVVSFGLTNKIRAVLPNGANKIAAQNQEGLLYNIGTGLGIAASLALNPAGAGAAWARGTAGVYSVAGMTYGALESTGNILKGEGTVWDALNLIPALQLARASKGSRTVSSAVVEADAAVTQVAKNTQCFVAGTEIQTLDGTKNIEDIHVGDWVLSDDPNTPGDIEYKQVLQTFVKETSNLVDIYIDGEKITTEEHPFWVPDVGWVAAKDLHAGSHLQTKYESWLDVDRVVKHSDTATVYNFEVEGFHTYFVSDLGLLVHNTCKTVFNSSVKDVFYSNSKAPTGANTYPLSDLLAPSADPYRVRHSSFGDYNNATKKQIVDARIAHQNRFGNLRNFNPLDVMGLRLNGGGHGQENINHLIANGLDFNMLHIFENGVRTGNVPGHISPGKREGVSQSWFPESWGRAEIEAAGKHVANLHSIDSYKHGTTLFADYNGVRVGIYVNDLQPSRIGTIFPDSGYQPPINYPRLLEVNPYK